MKTKSTRQETAMLAKEKKHRVRRMAGLALAFTLVTTGLLAGTIAKYISDGSSTHTARVAKWGVEIQTDGDLFNVQYLKDDETFGQDHSVITDPEGDGERVFAPGTSGSSSFSITGKPEVATRVSINVPEDGISIDGENHPLYFALTKDGETVYEGTEILGEGGLESAFQAFVGDFPPGTDLENEVGGTFQLSWVWDYETGDDANDVLIAENEITYNLNFNIVVEQID